jgi:branched-chain amino acid transport system substrate-binding protein
MHKTPCRYPFAMFVISLMFFLPFSASAEAVKVGVLLHLKGEWAQFGQIQENSLMIALEDVQGHCGQDKTLIPIIQDVSDQPEKVRFTMEKLIKEERVSVIVSGVGNPITWEAASVAQAHKVPLLITGASEDRLTEQGWDYVFRLPPPMSEYWNGFLWFMSEVVSPKTIAVLSVEGISGMLKSSNMVTQCKKAGYNFVFDQTYKKETTDFNPVLKQIKAKNPDVIALASFLDDSVRIMRQCRELDIHPLVFMGLGGGYSLSEFGLLAGDASNYVFSVSWWNPSVPYAGSREYYDAYIKRYHAQPDFLGAELYAATQVLADAVSRASKCDPEGLQKALASTDLETIVGPVKFVSYSNKTQQNRLPTYLIQWLDGEMKTVWPPKLASRKYVFPFPGWGGE